MDVILRSPMYSAVCASAVGMLGLYVWTQHTESGRLFASTRDQNEMCRIYLLGGIALAVAGYLASGHFYASPGNDLIEDPGVEDFVADQTMLTESYD